MSKHPYSDALEKGARIREQIGRKSGPISRIGPIGPTRRSAPCAVTSLGRRYVHPLALTQTASVPARR
jgi:hypothetical protein